MLPFENRAWAKPAARAMITATLLFLAIFFFLIHRLRPLDVPEIALIVLVLVGILPPNIAILLRKRNALPPAGGADLPGRTSESRLKV